MLYETNHFRRRIEERDISNDDIAAALCGIKISHHSGTEEKYLDRKTRTYVVVSKNKLVTAMKLRRKQMRSIIERANCKSYIYFSGITDYSGLPRGRKKYHDKFTWQTYVSE